MNTVCIIPARGGSKGIPKKNLVKLGKYSLLEHTIADAYELKCPIYVTTDDDQIAFVAQEADATVIKRPAEISGDDASTEDAVMHVLETLETPPETIVFLLQCTSPFRKPGELVEALEYFEGRPLDSLFSSYELYPYAWTDEGTRVVYDHRGERTMRQDKSPLYIEDGSFYIARASGYYRFENRLHGKIGRWNHDKIYGMEVDEWEDLIICQTLLNWLQESGKV